MASRKIAYAASADLTVTALNGAIASSTTWVTGWTSGTIDNTTNLYLDYLVSGKLVAESAGLTAGEVRVYVYAMMDDTNWPDIFSAGTEGTEGAATVHDTNILAGHCRLLWSCPTDTTASQVYPIAKSSVAALFGGVCPSKFAIYIAHSMVAALETAGNQVTIQGVYETVA